MSNIFYQESDVLPLADQYELLRDEMLLHMKQVNTIELAAAISVGATYTFSIANKAVLNDHLHGAVWYIPTIIICLCGIRCIVHTMEMKRIGKFLREIERVADRKLIKAAEGQLAESSKDQEIGILGWEHFKKVGSIRHHDLVAMVGGGVIWIAALIITILVSHSLAQ